MEAMSGKEVCSEVGGVRLMFPLADGMDVSHNQINRSLNCTHSL